jgi:dolichol-phosphate mannosyltransferase
MADDPQLSVVIPVYNEGPNIEASLRALYDHVDLDMDVIVVYDMDNDTTVPVLERVADQFDGLRWIKNDIARGPSGAIRTGLLDARGPRVLVMMADLCDDVSQIPALVDQVPGQADVACPSRYCPGGEQQLDATFKIWFPRAAGFLLNGIAGIPTLDPTNSYKMYSSAMLKNMTLVSTTSFSVTLEIVVKAHCLGYRIAELPTTWKDRSAGESKFNLWRSVATYTPWFLLALGRNRIFRISPSWLPGLRGCRGPSAG